APRALLGRVPGARRGRSPASRRRPAARVPGAPRRARAERPGADLLRGSPVRRDRRAPGAQPRERPHRPPPRLRAAAPVRRGSCPVSGCLESLTDDALLDWWAGELEPAEARRVERHLLSCGSCSGRAGTIAAVASGTSALVREGRLPAVLAPVVVERLRRERKRIREYRVAPGGGVQCTVGPDDDVVLARLGADFAGVTRVDLV